MRLLLVRKITAKVAPTNKRSYNRALQGAIILQNTSKRPELDVYQVSTVRIDWRFDDGSIRRAEIHWYEATGIGKKEFKIKYFLD